MTFMRWTSANKAKGLRTGWKHDGTKWLKVEQRGDVKKEKPVSESQVPGAVLDEFLERPVLAGQVF